jgi:hypothetical protein
VNQKEAAVCTDSVRPTLTVNRVGGKRRVGFFHCLNGCKEGFLLVIGLWVMFPCSMISHTLVPVI